MELLISMTITAVILTISDAVWNRVFSGWKIRLNSIGYSAISVGIPLAIVSTLGVTYIDNLWIRWPAMIGAWGIFSYLMERYSGIYRLTESEIKHNAKMDEIKMKLTTLKD